MHGSGLLYRNCFLGRALDFRQYDRLFPYAKAQESFELVGRMVTGRLWFPHQLSQAARQQYEDYARGEWEAFARRFVRERDLRGIQWLAGLAGEEGRQWYGPMAELAAREHFAEAVSFLMESRRASGAPAGRRRRLEL